MRTSFCLFLAALTLQAKLVAEPLPDLAKLKIAAESGDPVAEFQYANRVRTTAPHGYFDWFMKSALQGYAPAEDAVAADLEIRYVADPKKKQALERQAIRWASRAAYQGIVSAQTRLSRAYFRGKGVPKNPMAAYMWIQIAVQSANGSSNLFASLMPQSERDVIISNVSSGEIAEGQRRAAAFRPGRYSGRTNPVEADVIFGQLRLVAIYDLRDHLAVVVNDLRYNPGETKDLMVDGESARLTCVSIQGKSARFRLADSDFEVVLALKS
ncbi:MAG TPA: tetratricopeptide repeat protein [Candidatus Didemnitutus sp.]|jgi:TPR repeat protein